MHENYFGIRSPRASKVERLCVFISRDVAVVKDIAKIYLFGRRCCGNIALVFAVQFTIFKPGRGPAKNKIYSTFDIALVIKLSCSLPESV